jgi:hypothetical protein
VVNLSELIPTVRIADFLLTPFNFIYFLVGGGTQDSSRIQAIEREILDLKIGRTYHGVSTEAEWAQDLKNRGCLCYDQSFQSFLEQSKYSYWPTNQLPTFPVLKSSESDVCQPFVDHVINLIAANQGFKIKANGQFFSKASSLCPKQTITSAHDKVSYSTRKPDIVIYNGNHRGACAISIVGDVKGCRSTVEFPDAEVGHILDMSKVLLNEHQFCRTLLYSFLTDGFRFQFFRCSKDSAGSFEFKSSSVFTGLDGWQVLLLFEIYADKDIRFCLVFCDYLQKLLDWLWMPLMVGTLSEGLAKEILQEFIPPHKKMIITLQNMF